MFHSRLKLCCWNSSLNLYMARTSICFVSMCCKVTCSMLLDVVWPTLVQSWCHHQMTPSCRRLIWERQDAASCCSFTMLLLRPCQRHFSACVEHMAAPCTASVIPSRAAAHTRDTRRNQWWNLHYVHWVKYSTSIDFEALVLYLVFPCSVPVTAHSTTLHLLLLLYIRCL